MSLALSTGYGLSVPPVFLPVSARFPRELETAARGLRISLGGRGKLAALKAGVDGILERHRVRDLLAGSAFVTDIDRFVRGGDLDPQTAALRLGQLAGVRSDLRSPAVLEERDLLGLGRRPVSIGDEEVFLVTLDPRRNPMLRDHMFEREGVRRALLPGVAFMQMASQAAMNLHGGFYLRELRDVEFLRTLFVRADARADLHLAMKKVESRDMQPPTFGVELRGPPKVASDPPVVYARGTVVLGRVGTAGIVGTGEVPPGLVLTGRKIYQPVNYPNTGIMAVLDRMTVYGGGQGWALFNPEVLGRDRRGRIVGMMSLPLQLDLGFEAAGFLDILKLYRDNNQRLRGLQVPSTVRQIVYGARPDRSELKEIQVRVRPNEDGSHDIQLFNSLSGVLYALVGGFRTATWNPWKDQQPPLVGELLGLPHQPELPFTK